MPTITLNESPNDGVTVLAAVTSPSTQPGADPVIVATNGFRDVRTLVSYGGAVSACTLQLWILNARTGAWHAGAAVVLDPAEGPTARDWFDIGRDEQVTFTAAAISGGSVTVHVTGI
jgi:hypothetical protein